MKLNTNRVLNFVILALLMIVIVQKCFKPTPTPPEQMTAQQIENILRANFDTMQNNYIEIIDTKVKEIDELLNNSYMLTSSQRAVLDRLSVLDKDMRDRGEQLRNYIELNAATKQVIKETVYYVDSTGRENPVPDYLKRLPLVIRSNYKDSTTIVDISYDVQKDTITSSMLTMNRFKLSQSVDKNGKSIATITNDNPYTYTLPGTSVFNLDIPEPRKPSPFALSVQAGYFIDKDLKVSPGVGVGVSYNIGRPISRAISKVFSRK